MALDTSGLYKTWPIGAEVRSDGKAIHNATQAYGQLIIDTQATWTAMDASFRSPENQVETAKRAYDDLIVGGTAIGTAGSRVRDALVTYGDTVDDLQRDRRLAQTAAREFNAKVADGDEVPDSGEGSEAAVQQQIDNVVQRLQTAMETCAEVLNKIDLELDIDSFVSGPVPNIITTVLKDGVKNLGFSDIEYIEFNDVKTTTSPGIGNRLSNTSIDVGMKSSFPFIGVDIDYPKTERDKTRTKDVFTETKSNFLLPASMAWMGKIPGKLGEKYRTRVGKDNRAENVTKKTSKTTVKGDHWWSKDREKTKTKTKTSTSNQQWRPDKDSGRSKPTTTGWKGVATRTAKSAGFVGDVVGVAFTFEGNENQYEKEFANDPKYADLSPQERENEVTENTVVKTATDTTIDLAAGGTGAAIGAAFGGPIGAVAGFGIGIGLSWASDQDWFGGKSAKDWAGEKANQAVDWAKGWF